MSIKRILNYIDKANLVPLVRRRDKGEEILSALGERVVQNHNDNESTMNDWSMLIDDGMNVAKLETDGSSYPWENAANYKSPLITEAVRQFGDRAKTEIMSSDKLVACKIEGLESEAANAAMDRIEKHMNWQINCEMRNWRMEHTRCLYTLAASGAYFKKTYYDSTEGCNRSKIVKYPNFSIHQECDNMDDGNFTEVLYYYPNDIWERKAAGIWEVPEDLVPKSDSEDARNQDNYCFLEQFCNYDLDGDGYEEPVIVTVHKNSATVVRIVTRYDVESIHVNYQGNTYNLEELIKARAQPPTQNEQFNQAYITKQIEDIEKNSDLVRIVPEELLTYYGFIEPTDGSFLSWGYLHILASVVKGVNKTTNALLNSGELANLQGGWLSKEHRDRRSGNYKVKPGHFKQTNIAAPQMANSIYPLPFKEPSQTLLALNQEIKAEIQTMSAKFNTDDAMKSGVSAASVLGALQEGIVPTSSLIMNVITAMSHEFSIMFRLNGKYTEPLIYQSVTGNPNYEQDYAQAVMIKPTANAMFSNQMQRISLAQAQMEQIEMFLQIGGNPTPIVKGYYEALGTPNMDQLFPEQMTSKEEEQRERMLANQEAQTKAVQQQNQILQKQLQLAQMDAERRVFEAQAKAQKDQQELQQKAAKLQNEIISMQRKGLMEDAETRMKMDKQAEELKLIRADVLKRLAEVDKTMSESAQIEQTLIGGDVNAIQALNDDQLLAMIGVTRNG